ncbi:MAG: hypothetical protein WC850_00380 [Candidatus Gracilibacteria bacterium]
MTNIHRNVPDLGNTFESSGIIDENNQVPKQIDIILNSFNTNKSIEQKDEVGGHDVYYNLNLANSNIHSTKPNLKEINKRDEIGGHDVYYS